MCCLRDMIERVGYLEVCGYAAVAAMGQTEPQGQASLKRSCGGSLPNISRSSKRMWSWLPRLCRRWFVRARVLRDLVAQYAACTYRRSQTGAKKRKAELNNLDMFIQSVPEALCPPFPPGASLQRAFWAYLHDGSMHLGFNMRHGHLVDHAGVALRLARSLPATSIMKLYAQWKGVTVCPTCAPDEAWARCRTILHSI